MVLTLTKIDSGLAPSIEARHGIYVSSGMTGNDFSELNRASKPSEEHPINQPEPENKGNQSKSDNQPDSVNQTDTTNQTNQENSSTF